MSEDGKVIFGARATLMDASKTLAEVVQETKLLLEPIFSRG